MEKKRPWFRMHVSTAIVLMFVAGGLMWANMIPERFEIINFPREHYVFEEFHFGWPWKAYEFGAQKGKSGKNYDLISGWMITKNLLTALSILSMVWFICEWWIRHREKKGM